MTSATTSREFFDRLYAGHADPWHFAASAYELERYETTLRAIRGRRYRRAFEPGCSIGVLTASLAILCEQVEAIDISPVAVGRARARCLPCGNVTLRAASLPGGLPLGSFDLIVLSEIGYYFDPEPLREITESLVERLDQGGILIAVHWLGHSDDHILHGDTVHDVIGHTRGLFLDHSERHPGFRLDRWCRV